MKGRLREDKANILEPESAGLALILNVCDVNLDSFKDENKLLQMLAKRWGTVRTDVKMWATDPSKYKLGNITSTLCQSTVWVVSLLCLKNKEVDKKALNDCFKKLADFAKYEGGSIHISKNFLELVPESKELLNVLLDAGLNVVTYKN